MPILPRALRQELRGCVSAYEAAKAKAGALDFLDLLLKTRDLIRDNAEVRSSFQQRFKRIFVDEFQDTDPLQAEILLLLAADDPAATNWRETRPVRGKLFLVGDPKQSIYRFRRADVGIYRSVYEMLQAAGARTGDVAHQFSRAAEYAARHQRRLRAGDDRRRRRAASSVCAARAVSERIRRPAVGRRASRARAVRLPKTLQCRRLKSRFPMRSAPLSIG